MARVAGSDTIGSVDGVGFHGPPTSLGRIECSMARRELTTVDNVNRASARRRQKTLRPGRAVLVISGSNVAIEHVGGSPTELKRYSDVIAVTTTRTPAAGCSTARGTWLIKHELFFRGRPTGGRENGGRGPEERIRCGREIGRGRK